MNKIKKKEPKIKEINAVHNLYNKEGLFVYNVAKSIVGERSIAEKITKQVFTQLIDYELFRYIPKETEKVKHYLYEIAYLESLVCLYVKDKEEIQKIENKTIKNTEVEEIGFTLKEKHFSLLFKKMTMEQFDMVKLYFLDHHSIDHIVAILNRTKEEVNAKIEDTKNMLYEVYHKQELLGQKEEKSSK